MQSEYGRDAMRSARKAKGVKVRKGGVAGLRKEVEG